ncbi:hypothetical protein CLV92_101512 [Kineococcus xinjiangensis]|uniref:ARB-07466-like C-terminal domain-containing protein n=1 Tax=Kineococcus xinjiangensis TaxID=512762 RepID=A0A2S6IXD9_9ACTN|nr:hypothetical protein CLV92_101512 [Kineococcus xinjiangensis]
MVAGAAVLAVTATAVWMLREEEVPVLLRERCIATVEGQSTDWSPEQMGNAATIVGLSVRRELPARAATIAIATAIQESTLRNLDHGDRDSLGLFQQRPSMDWGSPEQVQDPVYATNAFYDGLAKVDGYRDMAVTDAAQEVQRSAFPLAYGDHEQEGRILASSLTGHSPASLTCRLRPVDDVAVELPGEGGLTPRAQRVADELAEQVSERGVRPVDGALGRAWQFEGGEGAEGERLAWAVAHWAVARADALDVEEVSVGKLRWQRSEPDAGWAPTQSPLGPSTVDVRVAHGE